MIETKEIIDTIMDINCFKCPEFLKDVRVSECICEPVMDVIHRCCAIKDEDDECSCCRIWEDIREKYFRV